VSITFYTGKQAKWAIASVCALQCFTFSTKASSEFESIARYIRFLQYAKGGCL